MSQPSGESAFISLTKAAELLGIHRATAYKLARDNEFPVPVVQVGDLKKVNREALAQFIEESRSLKEKGSSKRG